MATATAPVDPSTRRLSEVARHVVAPVGIVDTLWFAVDEQCREWGDRFDAWQDGLGQLILGLDEDGMFAATVGGVTISIPRQVAKTFIIMRIVFALCAKFPGLTVLWTAHHSRTATQTFRKLQGYATRKVVAPHVDYTRSANGEQEIRFKNGSAIMFGARSMGFGRGFDEVDIEVFDEAQILDEKALEDMIPAANQSRFEHGALVIFMGTPPRPIDPGEVFSNRRAKALAAKPDDVVYAEHGNALYVECSADSNVGQPGGPSLDDPEQLRKANPSYPHRTPQASIDRMREQLPSDDGWRREGLGVWDEMRAAWVVIGADKWAAVGVPKAPAGGVPCYGVKFSVDGVTVALAAGVKVGGVVHAELVEHKSMVFGVEWLAKWLADRKDTASEFVIDGKAGRDDLVAALRRLKVPPPMIHLLSTDEVIQAHTSLLNAVNTGGMTHAAVEGQKPLDDAVANAGKRKIGTAGGWGWAPLDGAGDMTPLDAVTLAHFGAATTKRKRGAGRSSDGRRAVLI